MRNKSNTSIKLIWNDVTFVDYEGISSRVIHNGIKYSSGEEANMPSSVLIRGSKISDCIVPVRKIRFDDYSKKWVTDNLLNQEGNISLLIPLLIGDTVNEYILTFASSKHYVHPELMNKHN